MPESSWGLAEWLDALALRDIELANLLVSLGLKSSDRHAARYIYDIKSAKRPQRIATREDALCFIEAFNSVAERKGLEVMSCGNLLTHANIFLTSPKICSHSFVGLQETELQAFCGRVRKNKFSGFDLLDKVHPKPPLQLFGRDEDIVRVLRSIEKNPVTVVSGIAGNGKTSLTWFSIQQAIEGGLLADFDWTTDKRYVLDQYGKEIQTGVKPLNFNAILRSMIARFGWSDLIGEMDDDLAEACALRLQQQKYLLVVDNLETIPDSEYVVNQLLDILARGFGKPPVSRAIVTSRYTVNQSDCANVPIEGIAPSSRLAYISYLLETTNMPPLSTSQATQLAEVTQGNPLFIQLALQRFSVVPYSFDQIIEDIRYGSNFNAAFQNLFAPLVNDLKENHPKAYWLMVCAAHLSVLQDNELQLYWSEAFEDSLDEYYEALAILKSKMILSTTDSAMGEFTMHSLIQTYLRGLAQL